MPTSPNFNILNLSATNSEIENKEMLLLMSLALVFFPQNPEIVVTWLPWWKPFLEYSPDLITCSPTHLISTGGKLEWAWWRELLLIIPLKYNETLEPSGPGDLRGTEDGMGHRIFPEIVEVIQFNLWSNKVLLVPIDPGK